MDVYSYAYVYTKAESCDAIRLNMNMAKQTCIGLRERISDPEYPKQNVLAWRRVKRVSI